MQSTSYITRNPYKNLLKMKFAIPEISWHNRDPVLSVDFQPKSETGDPLRLATGGTDSHVLIWHISTTDAGSVNLEVAADLTRHQKAVNVVRWSPSGQLLASGDDESIIFVWRLKNEEPAPAQPEEDQYKETWVIHKTLRGHMEDVLDISWSADSLQLASGSVDNKLLVWDVQRGKYSCILTDHKGFVQGVSWDPQGQLIGSASTDRVFRTFDVATKKVTSRSSKAILPFPSTHPLHNTCVRLYQDDTLQTYYRRLQFSPDGMLVAVPAGRIEPEQGKSDMKPVNAVYIYTRYSLKVPACVLPCGDAALVVRWSPRRYALRTEGPPPAFPTDARQILAVATKRSVLLYDTQQRTPIAIISNIHYTRLTDLTWSPDGRTLVASSTDGFCSVIMFGEGELGEVLPQVEATPLAHTAEPMEVQDEPQAETKDEQKKEDPKPTPKINSYMKFKAPTEKSPKTPKTNGKKDKTPVKLDVFIETAMPSWSDNSNSDVVKATEKQQLPVEIVEIEDSTEDMKLVYEDTVNQSQSPEDIAKNSDKKAEITEKASPERMDTSVEVNTPTSSKKTKTNTSPKQPNTPTNSKRVSPKQVDMEGSRTEGSEFMKQAKVTDVKEPALKAVPSPKAPRRVSFVTLSSPKNKKKC